MYKLLERLGLPVLILNVCLLILLVVHMRPAYNRIGFAATHVSHTI